MGKEQTGKSWNRPVTDEAIFKASKEIVVKFIEVGRLSPAGFEKAFARVHAALKKSVRAEDDHAKG